MSYSGLPVTAADAIAEEGALGSSATLFFAPNLVADQSGPGSDLLRLRSG
jgi:hypothetical protein